MSVVASPAIAQSAYPARTVKLIVPAGPGTRHGVSARLFAQSLERHLGQSVQLETPDATPASSYGLIAGASADGYTLGFAAVDLGILHWRGLTPLTPRDVTPLALINEDPAGIHVRADSPWQTARQLTDHVKANPGRLSASSTPAGGIWHLSTVGWLGAAGVKSDALPWVPATGPASAVEDMLLGGSDVVVCSTPEVRDIPKGKSIRTLAIMGRNRVPRFGNIPTLQEALGTPHVAGAWRGLVAPAGLDPATAAAITNVARRAWQDAAFQTQMRRRGYLPAWAAGGEFRQYMQASSARLGRALKQAGLA